MECKFEGSDARDKIRNAMQKRAIPSLAIRYILDEARSNGTFTSGGFSVTVTFRNDVWRLISRD